MKTFVLTGGIASGKSTLGRMLCKHVPSAVLFDCDRMVRELLDSDLEVRNQIAGEFGSQAISEGKVNRNFLRAHVFQHPAERIRLEGILHPRVRKECLDSLDKARNSGAGMFVADVPLFFETGFDFGQDQVLVVASSRPTQIRRLQERGGFDDSLIEHVLSAQLPVEEKIRKADVIFWNEGPLSVLEAQVGRFSKDYLMTNTNESEAPHADAAASDTAAVQTPAAPIPTTIDINEFRLKPLVDLQAMAEVVPARIPGGIPKSQLIYELLCFYGREGAQLLCEGVVEPAKENFAMLRDPVRSFRPGADDIHINANLLREYGIRAGQRIKLQARIPRERDKFLTTEAILEIEGLPAAEFQQTKDFDQLTPLFPNERVHLEGDGPDFLGVRLIDLIAPLGKGQRGIIVAPPRGGKTILLKQIARSIQLNHPEAELLILLLDERPEEVTDFEETVGAEVFASTFDEPPKRHAQVADLVLERAKRLVEQKKDVILLLDSLTRLARGHNSASQGGPIGSGGVSPAALQKSRKFFGTARNVEEGGSLTILATALVETESRLDDVVFEEFKGTGNMEVRLDRELAERRVFPAIHIPQSGTRNDDRLYHPDEFLKVVEIRKQLAQLPIGDALTSLLTNLKGTKTNAELLLRGLR